MITKINNYLKVDTKLTSKNSKFLLLNFEPVSNELEEKLIGGFSQSVSVAGPTTTIDDGASNNCMGGNCTNGCGMGGQNSGCNATSGCSGGTNFTYGCK